MATYLQHLSDAASAASATASQLRGRRRNSLVRRVEELGFLSNSTITAITAITAANARTATAVTIERVNYRATRAQDKGTVRKASASMPTTIYRLETTIGRNINAHV
jgi:hypothetical protein